MNKFNTIHARLNKSGKWELYDHATGKSVVGAEIFDTYAEVEKNWDLIQVERRLQA